MGVDRYLRIGSENSRRYYFYTTTDIHGSINPTNNPTTHHTSLHLLQTLLSRLQHVSRQLTCERKERDSIHVRQQLLGNLNSLRRLVVLQNTAQRARQRTQRRVQHVDVLLVLVRLLRRATANLHRARLVIGAVTARHQLAIRVVAGEPALQVVLLGGSVVQRARNDVDDVVGKSERLVELATVLDHVFVHVPTLLRLANHKLLHLVELVNAEDDGVTG